MIIAKKTFESFPQLFSLEKIAGSKTLPFFPTFKTLAPYQSHQESRHFFIDFQLLLSYNRGMAEKDFTRLSEISKSIKGIIKDKSQEENILVWKAWMDSSGDIISSKAMLHSVRGETLIVEVEDEQWHKALLSMKHQLINRVNRWIGEERYSDIIFEIRDHS